jgi:glycosyltransferase involved in cell wall biosynthesis
MGFHTDGFKEYGLRAVFRSPKPVVWPRASTPRPAEPPPTPPARKVPRTVNVAIYNMCFATLGGGERRTAALAAHLAERHDVTLFVLSPLDISIVKSVFGIDLSRVRVTALHGKDHAHEIGRSAPDLFVNNSYGSTLECPAPVGIYMCMFPVDDMSAPSSYDVITANSNYVAGWIGRRWACPSEVVYSACNLIGPSDTTKRPSILNVGRFFHDVPGAHHKRQDVLLEAFRRMVDAGVADWDLHLVGNVDPDSPAQTFVEHLRRAGESFPVRISTCLPLDALRREYQAASIYWHATGYGCDHDREPSKLEHFGMSIVEAMSAGAVPLAYNGGGPREIITSGVNGFLWSDPDELVAHTRRLLDDPALRQAMAARTVADSRRFGVQEFLDRMDAVIASLETAPRLNAAQPAQG